MSTFTLALANDSKSNADTPGVSGTLSKVIFDSPTSCTTPEMIGSSIFRLPSLSSPETQVPCSHVKLDRTWIGTS